MQEQSIFIEALEKTAPAERDAYLDRVCAGDQALRDRIERLLQRHEQAGSFLEPSVAGGADATTDVPLSERPGTVVGPFKLLEKIGEGGFGVVFMAEQQQPIRRKVALKVLKPGMDTSQVVARFEAERQALALMNHPNIAHVIDGGQTDSGRPYFVMELVKGIPITQYCDELQLSPRERLALFVPVCEAVQHAHQKGIIHRDLKPSNVLVAAYDGHPVPKVIDFGVAKAMGQQLTERTLVTSFGGIIGTLEYMSPEQAEFNAQDIDTRADIYGLGVLLYELLTGSTPLMKQRLRDAAITEVLRLIREEEPQIPSTRLKDSRESLASISAQRKLEPARLTKQVRGELDWIAMKCLEKDRARRYATANGLARDIQRYLSDEPVEAGPPSASYRLRKFARKHRRLLGATGAFVLLLAAGAIVSTWQAIRATRAEGVAAHERTIALAEKERASQEAAIAKAVNEFLQVDLLGQADISNQPANEERDKNITARELLDRASREIDAKFRGQVLTEAAIRLTLGRAYHALGEFGQARKHLERSLELRQEKLGHNHADTVDVMNYLGLVYRDTAKFDEAESLFRRAVETTRAEFGPDHRTTLTSLSNLANLQTDRGRYGEAESLFNEVLERQRRHLGENHLDTLTTMMNVARVHGYHYRFDQAERLYKQVLAGRRAQLGNDHPATLNSMANLATLYRNWGRPFDAEPLYKELHEANLVKLSPEHPKTLWNLLNLAVVYSDTRRFDEGEALHTQVLNGFRASFGTDHPHTLLSTHNFGHHYWLQKRYDKAEPLFRSAYEGRRVKLNPDHPETLLSMHSLGVVLRDLERYDEALPLLQEAVDRTKKTLGLGHVHTQAYITSLTFLHQKRGAFQDAEPQLRELVEFLRTQGKSDTLQYADQLIWLSRCLSHQGKHAEEEPVARECLAIRQKKQPDEWTTFNMQSLVGNAILRQKRFAEAEPFLLQGYQGLKARESKIPKDAKIRLVQALERLVELYDVWGKETEAARWRKELDEEKARLK